MGFMEQTDPNFLLSSSPFMTSSFCRRGLLLYRGAGYTKGPHDSPSAVIQSVPIAYIMHQ
jgi:hypothetical protein